MIWFHFYFIFKIKKNVFLQDILSALLKNLEIGKKCSGTSLSSAANWIVFLAWKTSKFGFLYFYKSCRELNFLSKNINPESIGILSRKLWPKYETGAEDLHTSFKISNGDQTQICSSLSNRLIPSFSFRRKVFFFEK